MCRYDLIGTIVLDSEIKFSNIMVTDFCKDSSV